MRANIEIYHYEIAIINREREKESARTGKRDEKKKWKKSESTVSFICTRYWVWEK